ncbi:MAG: FAD-dependent oxidoreductase [Promethearchaeota archaeon]
MSGTNSKVAQKLEDSHRSDDNVITYIKGIDIKIKCDILVVGGSQSGVAAAVSAKRTRPDLSVHLIEQFGNLGGQSVNTMVCHWEFREYTNNAGQIIAKGIGKEMIKRIVAKGHSDPLYKEWLEGKGPPFKDYPDPRAYGDIALNVEDIKLVLQEMCDEAGVKVHLFTKLVDVIEDNARGDNVDNNEINNDEPNKPSDHSHFTRTKYVVVQDYYDLYAIEPQIVVDCTANNEVAWKLKGLDGVYIPKQIKMPMQTYAWFGNVDAEKFIEDVWKHKDWWPLLYPNNKEQCFKHVKEGKGIVLRGGVPYLDIADEKFDNILEEFEKYCNPIIYYWLKPIKYNPVSFEKNGKKFVKYISTWAIEGPISFKPQFEPENISDFMQKQLKAVELLRKVHSVLPGWENCVVERTATSVGLRQTRILKGIYELTADDVKNGRTKRQYDVIGRGSGHDVSRHNPKYEYGYDIPYRCLVPKEIDALLVGGRSISCDPNDPSLTALNAHRGISATIIVSQAAGTAAAICVSKGIQPRNIDIKELQDELRKQDVVLEPPSD